MNTPSLPPVSVVSSRLGWDSVTRVSMNLGSFQSEPISLVASRHASRA